MGKRKSIRKAYIFARGSMSRSKIHRISANASFASFSLRKEKEFASRDQVLE